MLSWGRVQMVVIILSVANVRAFIRPFFRKVGENKNTEHDEKK